MIFRGFVPKHILDNGEEGRLYGEMEEAANFFIQATISFQRNKNPH